MADIQVDGSMSNRRRVSEGAVTAVAVERSCHCEIMQQQGAVIAVRCTEINSGISRKIKGR